MIFRIVLPLALSFVILCGSSPTSLSIDETEDKIDHGAALVEWLLARGGFFHPNLEIRNLDKNDEKSPLGLFAKDFISSKALMMKIPRSCVIAGGPVLVGDLVESTFSDGITYLAKVIAVHERADDKKKTTYDLLFEDGETYKNFNHKMFTSSNLDCGTVRQLAAEMRLGNASQYSAYVNYLKSQPYGQLPSSWSKEGQKVLLGLLGQNSMFDNEQSFQSRELPPSYLTGWIEEDWVTRCQGNPDDWLSKHAYYLVTQRGWDEVLIPVYDMMSHRNGDWLNTQCDPVRKGKEITVSASRDIAAGEQIYTTYNFCVDCEGRVSNYGTPEIMRDYGFVEQFPQRWVFHMQNLAFDLVQRKKSDGLSFLDELEVQWFEPVTSESDLKWLEQQLSRLRDLKSTYLAKKISDVPDHEWNVISQYHNALIVALTHCIVSAGGDISDPTCLLQNETDVGKVSFLQSYDSLNEVREAWTTDRPITCDWWNSFHYDYWKTMEYIESPYQSIGFHYNPILKDICFDLDSTTQICSSYRPHYHEMVVHYTARFIESVKRVIFIGGGDSMLLHDILKYPSLELVVGLELDQQVTRGAFKYFGSQPHWDNEKVQWWYGDATKSLLMLPKEYFGSFDMVLVDLSETVMALTVTHDLDVMQALVLLVKPNGVVVKNEYSYFKDMSELFENTAHLFYYDVPLVCSQSLILGSNQVDFLRGKIYDHKIEHLYNLLDKNPSDNELVRDYQKNSTSSQKHCKSQETPQREQVKQERSPGILMIVEAEEATISLENLDEITKVVLDAINREGLSLISTLMPAINRNISQLVFVMQEGYILTRFWPKRQYLAFDIHFWGTYEKQDKIRRSLIEAVGSSVEGLSSSSYRIVAGGMFGVHTWKNDEKRRGPQRTDECAKHSIERTQPAKKGHVLSALYESISLVQQNDIVVALLCGRKEEACESFDVLKNHPKVKDVIVFWSCSAAEAGKNDSTASFDCEQEIVRIIQSEVAADKTINAIVLDANSSRGLGEVVFRIFSHSSSAMRWLRSDTMVAACVLNEKEIWRKVFVQKFREEIKPVEPVYSGSVLFNTSDSSFELDVMLSGDELFVQKLISVAEAVEKKTGLVSDMSDVRGGEFHFDGILHPSQIIMPNEFDQVSPLSQWNFQQPLGYQTVFQLEIQDGAPFSISRDDVKRAFGECFSEAIDPAFSSLSNNYEVQEISSVGSGSINIALWAGGSVVVLWDGRVHIDINLFTYAESKEFAESFVSKFKSGIDNLEITLRDEQPRGTGRVVNFLRDIEPRQMPFWTKDFQTYTGSELQGGIDDEKAFDANGKFAGLQYKVNEDDDRDEDVGEDDEDGENDNNYYDEEEDEDSGFNQAYFPIDAYDPGASVV